MTAPLRRVAAVADLTEDRALAVNVDGTDILLGRIGDTVHAVAGTCPHAGAPLAEGAICRGRIICPWHKGVFNLADGALIEPPALEGLARFPVQVDSSGEVMVSAQALPHPLMLPAPEARVFLIVGAGAAGAAAAGALRDAGFGGRIVLAGGESGDPFDRTLLSKFVIEGTLPPFEVYPLWPDGWYRRQRIERVRSNATRVDAEGRFATFANRQRVEFDAALICTGATPRRLDFPGTRLHGVWELRTRDNAAHILASARRGGRAVILGSSFIGLEVASGLRQQDVDVTVVAPDHVPFARQFGPEIGAAIKRLHEDNGVKFRLGIEASRIDGDRLCEAVVLQDGDRLPADFVVVGVGVQPATEFVQGVARGEDGGIAVDESMRAGAALWAAGDVAAFPWRGETIRVEHWRVAQQHARVAARSMLGQTARYGGVPFFWTYHYGKRFEYVGHATEWDSVEIDGDLGAATFVALLARAGEVQAVVACQRERATAMLYDAMHEPLRIERAKEIIARA